MSDIRIVRATTDDVALILQMIRDLAEYERMRDLAAASEADIRDALRFTFERWNGNGHPNHVKGEAIPLPMRVVHLSQDMEAIARIFSPEHALAAARDRRDGEEITGTSVS